MSARARTQLEPRLLSKEEAASYCGLSFETFRSACPVIPIKIRSRVLYDRLAIDRWLDSLGSEHPDLPSGKAWLARLERAGAD